MRYIRIVTIFLFAYKLTLNTVSSEDVFQSVRLRFYYGRYSSHTYIEFRLSETDKLLQHPYFQFNWPTIIYVHGWMEKMDEADTLLNIVKSYLFRHDHNVLVLNYQKLAENFYPTVVEHAQELGQRVALALSDLFTKGLNQQRIHLLGFSLGAHICGEIGRAIQPAYIIPRITGLDPAYPMYYGTGQHVELNKNDGKFVDIIHTDCGICGGPYSSGHADFYPNRGRRPQPGCGNTFWQYVSLAVGDHCAHDISVHYYARSVIAKKLIFFATNRLNPYDTVQMGYDCPNTALGDYDLNTYV